MILIDSQFGITLIVMCIVQKVSPYFSFGTWILSKIGLKRFLHPSDSELRNLCGIPKEKHGDKKTFYIPKNLNFNVYTTKISRTDLIFLKYYDEYKWLMDFSMYAGLVYVLSELFYFYFPHKAGGINLSLIWCLIVIFYGVKYLFRLAFYYFKYDESVGERSLCIVAFFMYLFLAMVVLILDESILETGLEEAYQDFSKKATTLLTKYGLSSKNIISKLVLKFIIAVLCGLLGALLIFPGIRTSKMHRDSIRRFKDDKIMQLALNISFVLPFISVILWIRSLVRDRLTVHVFEGQTKPLLTSESFETARLLIVIFTILLRFTLLPIYIQSYLNIAYDRIQDMKKEAGRITNVELKQKISSIFHYLCVAVLQFTAPLIICFYIALLYKNLSGISWKITGFKSASNLNTTATTSSSNEQSNIFTYKDEYAILETASSFQYMLQNLKEIFSATFYKGLLGFFLWWIFFTLFSTSSFGILYHSYFATV